MLKMKLSVDLGSPADVVWGIVGNFNGLPDWHPWVDRACSNQRQAASAAE